MVVVADDVALAGEGGHGHAGRRGLAGTILVHKVAGAAAEAGASLAEVAAIARDAAAAVRTMGVALTPCTVPAAGRPGFSLGEAEVELGLGIHGEPGVRRVPVEPADALVDRLLGPILAELDGDRVVLLVNNLGGTPAMELAIVARHAIDVLEQGGKRVERVYAGTFLSALEMAGVSLSVLPVDDRRLARLDAPTDAPAWPNAADRPRSRSASASPEPTAPPRPAAGPPRTAPGRRTRRRDRGGRPVVDRGRGPSDRAGSGRRRRRPGDQPGEGRAGRPGRLAHLPPRRARRDAARAVLDPAAGPRRHVRTAVRDAPASRRGLPAPSDPGAATTWANALRDGADGIGELGGAAVGDRTMLDALVPAAEALTSGLHAGLSPAAALVEAVAAADRGAGATASMSPRRGRSSYLGDRALGHPDPGAVAVVIWLRAVSQALEATD